jgi:hypothetical protein
MNRFSSHATLLALTLSLPALAAPIGGPIWLVDTPTNVIVIFDHGAILASHFDGPLGPFVSPSGFWEVRGLTLSALDNLDPASGGTDAVGMGFEIQHVMAPPGHVGDLAFGGAWSPVLAVNAAAAAGVPLQATNFGAATTDHPAVGHKDKYDASLVAGVAAGLVQITGVTLTISGKHEACPGDVDGDGNVGFSDLLRVLAAWGPALPGMPEDLDLDGQVGFADMLVVLSSWGQCPHQGH